MDSLEAAMEETRSVSVELEERPVGQLFNISWSKRTSHLRVDVGRHGRLGRRWCWRSGGLPAARAAVLFAFVASDFGEGKLIGIPHPRRLGRHVVGNDGKLRWLVKAGLIVGVGKEIGESVEGFALIIGEEVECAIRVVAADGVGEALRGRKNEILCGWNRCMHSGGIPSDGVSGAFGARVDDPDFETAIRVEGRTDIPCIDGVRRPCSAGGVPFVGKAARTERRDWGAIVIECSVDLSVSGELGVDARAS